MFIYDNNKVCVWASTRCGHTSMYGYFGFAKAYVPTGFGPGDWLNTSSRRVFVLRNPLDKFVSGKKFLESTANTDFFDLMNEDQIKTFHRVHTICVEFKYLNKDIPFDIIPFENLNEYIPVGKGTTPTYTSNVNQSDVDMNAEMEEMLKLYQYYRSNRNVISPEEWKELTP